MTPRLLICGLVALLFVVAGAGHAAAQATTGGAIATPGFRSGGINAVITSTSVKGRVLTVQFIIQNMRPVPIFISPITSADIGSAATSSAGNTYVIAQGGRMVSGMSPCLLAGARNLNEMVTRCLKELKTETMTRLEPGDTSVLAVSYERRAREDEVGDSVSFTLKFAVRGAPKQTEGLTDNGQTAGSPGVVTISFPLIPLKTG